MAYININAVFNEILSHTIQGNLEPAVQRATQVFAHNVNHLQQLESRNLLSANTDLVKVFIIALLRVGNVAASQSLFHRFHRLMNENEDYSRLIQAESAAKSGDYDTALRHVMRIGSESSLIKEARKWMKEIVLRRQEKANVDAIKEMAFCVDYDENEFYILGMKPIGHDSHVSIVNQMGEVVFEAEEERFTREKHADSIPLNSILAGMRQCRIHPAQVRYIAFSFSALEYSHAAKLWEAYYRDNGFPLDHAQMVRGGHINYERYNYMQKYMEALFFNAKVFQVKHHLAHCGGAFYSSPFRRSAILSIDGRGEFETVMLARGIDHHIEELDHVYSPHSMGSLYQCITYWLGLGTREEGKTMGLSSYGDPKVYYKAFRDHIIDIDDKTGKFTIHSDVINPEGIVLYDTEKFSDIFGIHHKMDTKNPQPEFAHVAAALQEVTEEVFLKMSKYLRELSGEEYLCMTGGVALNSVGNGKILKSNVFKDVCIHPAAHDGGTGLGAAMYVYYNHVPNHQPRETTWWVMEHPYLGSSFTEDEIVSAIRASGFPVRKHENSALYAAEQLSQGNIVGWFQGRMEVGPRALGNRSILGDPRQAEMKDLINKRVKFRENWRPFAPSVLKEDCGVYFDSPHESPYMLFVYYTKKDKLDVIPAITHVDETARVQTVEKNANPKYYQMIEHFKERTGVGLVLNTSLNVKGEPIICTPKEAIDCFLVGGMDAMVLGDYVLHKEDLPGTRWLEECGPDAILLNIPTRTGRINETINIDVPASPFFDDFKTDLAKMERFEAGSVDGIHSHAYLHTLESERIDQVLTEWKRVLKEDARLFIEVPNPHYVPTDDEKEIMQLQESLKNPAIPHPCDPVRSPMDVEALETLLAKHGFSLVRRLEKSLFHPEKIGFISLEVKKMPKILNPDFEDLRNYLNVTDEEIDQKASDESVRKGVHAVWTSKPRTTAKEIASVYNETDLLLFRRVYYYQKCKARNEQVIQCLKNMIEKLQKPTIPLLDYGCGTACLYKPFDGSKQVQITLADIESPSFTFTKWRYRHSSNIQFFDIDPEQFSLTGLFDIFICDNVLEHVLNPLELTKHLTEHLNPGGYALIDFCTQIEEYKTGHLEQSIAQYGVTMEYVHANYDRINTLFYRKK